MKKLFLFFLFFIIFPSCVLAIDGEYLVKRKGSVYDLNNNLLVDLRKGERVCLCSWSAYAHYFHVCSLKNELYGKIYSKVVGGKISNICSPNYTILPPEIEREAIKLAKAKKQVGNQVSETNLSSSKKNISKNLTSNEKFILLHDRAFDEGRKTFVFDDGNTYYVGNTKLGAKTITSNQTSQVVTQVLNKDKIKEELTYYKELFEEELIEKNEYDELRKALLAGIKEGSVTKTIIMNKPDNVAIKSQSDLSKLQEQLALEKRKVEAMESQAQAAQTTNKLIKEQERKKGWNALMQLGLGIAGGGLSPGGNQRQTNCYDTGNGNFNCTSYDW